jgi:3-isopropylmalate/(R)-2-methylmalate dehydratase large subunit
MQPKPKKCINVAGDLQFELHQRRCSLHYIKIVYLRRYWLFCGIRGKVFENMSMEGRMTVCNLVSKWGARRNVAPDQTTFDYLEGRLYTQKLLGMQ